MAFVSLATIGIFKTNSTYCTKNMFLKNKILNTNKVKIYQSCKLEKNQEKISYKKDENDENTLTFIQEITSEMKMIEWPSIDRLFKQFVIVVISLVFSAIFIYSVDGVFASLSKLLFEGN
jgi:preprotein translocase SecE subunit|mmetsp:Transcript_43418/g.63791  ORF Transcript_43418/g.63791 Transcript_43418/m.63791 type:complete len:120 (-) Transcript_43418:296-655(-)